MPHVLIIEDDVDLRQRLQHFLAEVDLATSAAGTGMDGVRALLSSQPDLVVLDLGLPDIDGRQILSMIRAVSRVPLIVATGADDEKSIIALLNSGADDYLVKPFDSAQLVARVKAVLRRSHGAIPGNPNTRVTVGELVLDSARRTAELGGEALILAPKEFDLLYYLAERAGQVISKRELFTEVWALPVSRADKTVDVHLSWLRSKLGESALAPRYLHTVRSVGVRLDAPASANGVVADHNPDGG